LVQKTISLTKTLSGGGIVELSFRIDASDDYLSRPAELKKTTDETRLMLEEVHEDMFRAMYTQFGEDSVLSIFKRMFPEKEIDRDSLYKMLNENFSDCIKE